MVAVRLMAPVTSALESAAWEDRRGRHELELVGPLFHDLDGHVGLETRGQKGGSKSRVPESARGSSRLPKGHPADLDRESGKVGKHGAQNAFGQRLGSDSDSKGAYLQNLEGGGRRRRRCLRQIRASESERRGKPKRLGDGKGFRVFGSIAGTCSEFICAKIREEARVFQGPGLCSIYARSAFLYVD